MSSSVPQRPKGVRQRSFLAKPLFDHIDTVDQPHRLPPAPLRDLVGDLDDALTLDAQPSRFPHNTHDIRAHPLRPHPQPESPATPPAEDDDQHVIYVRRQALEDAQVDMWRAERLAAQQHAWYSTPAAVPRPAGFSIDRRLGLILVGALSVIVLFVFLSRTSGLPILSGWNGAFGATGKTDNSLVNIFAQSRPAGDYTLKAPPSISAEIIDQILASYGSPAAGTGHIWYNLGLEYGIDPAFAVAFFIHESSAGTNPGWAGLKPDGGTTHNIGNIICAGYAQCYGRFRDYPSWEAGIKDWYRLIDVEYIQGRDLQTVEEVIPIYAPAFENNVPGYTNTIHQMVDQWRINGVAQ